MHALVFVYAKSTMSTSEKFHFKNIKK